MKYGLPNGCSYIYSNDTSTCTLCVITTASFPVPRPAFRRLAFRRLQCCKRQKAGRGTGNEATITRYWSNHMPSFVAQKCEQLYHKLAIIYPKIMTADSARTGTAWPVLVNKCGMHVEMVDGLFNIEYIVYYFTIHNLDKIILAEMLRSIFIPD